MADLISDIVQGRLQAIRGKQNALIGSPAAVVGGQPYVPAQGNWNAGNYQSMISQGIGNLVGAVNAPAVRQEAARQEGIQAEQVNYNREQDAQNLALKAEQLQQQGANADRTNALAESRFNSEEARNALATKQQNQLTQYQNSIEQGLGSLVDGFTKPIQGMYDSNKALMKSISTKNLTTDANGQLVLADTATDAEREAFSQLQKTPTGYSRDGLRQGLENLYSQVAQGARANNLPIPNKQQFMQEGFSRADSGLNFVSEISASQKADMANAETKIGELAELSKKQNIALANMELNTPEKYARFMAIPEGSPQRDAILNNELSKNGAFNNSLNKFTDSLTKLQERGITSVEGVFQAFAGTQEGADAESKSEIAITGSNIVRKAVADLNKTSSDFKWDVTDPNVLAVIEQTANRVGADKGGLVGDWDMDDSYSLGTTGDSTFYTELKTELKKLPTLKRVLETNSMIDNDAAKSVVANGRMNLLKSGGLY